MEKSEAASAAETREITALRREYASAMRALTPKERALVRKLPDCQYQTWSAGKKLGYSPHTVQSMLRRPRVARALAALDAMDLIGIRVSHRMVLNNYACLANSRLKDFYDENDNLLPPSQWPEEWVGAVQEYSVDEKGRPRIKLHEKRGANDALAKYLRMMPERLEVTGKDGGPIETTDTRERNLGLIERLLQREVASAAAGSSEPSGASADHPWAEPAGVSTVSVGLEGMVGEAQSTSTER